MTDLTNPRFMDAVAYIHPTAVLSGPVQLRDVRLSNDGSGPVIAAWKIPGPIPTDAEIAVALTAIGSLKTSSGNYDAMIRRRAAALTVRGKPIDALILLHTIGE